MSFKKVGINYISDKLLKCLLQDGSKYYVELKNGIRIPVAQADYEAIATDLVVVNGVAYADLSVIASCKQLVGGYIVEFANGNQLTTTELNFNALVEAGFCAIGDTYYNPDDIDKVYAVAGGYFAEMVNGQKVVMTEEEYDAIVGGDQPAGGLTPFSQGQSITGYDFGDVSNGDTSAEMDAFLAGLTYEGTDPTVIVNDSENVLFATNFDEAYVLAVDSEEPTIVYSSVALSEQGITQGFQNLTNGKYTLQSAIEVTDVNPAEGWNGILIGAVEGGGN